MRKFLLLLAAMFLLTMAALTHAQYNVDATCQRNAYVAYQWAAVLRDTYGMDEKTAAQRTNVNPLSVAEELRAMVAAHTRKGIELVWRSDPAMSPDAVAATFYNWCMKSNTVPTAKKPKINI